MLYSPSCCLCHCRSLPAPNGFFPVHCRFREQTPLAPAERSLRELPDARHDRVALARAPLGACTPVSGIHGQQAARGTPAHPLAPAREYRGSLPEYRCVAMAAALLAASILPVAGQEMQHASSKSALVGGLTGTNCFSPGRWGLVGIHAVNPSDQPAFAKVDRFLCRRHGATVWARGLSPASDSATVLVSGAPAAARFCRVQGRRDPLGGGRPLR